jgi:hypothetical protein
MWRNFSAAFAADAAQPRGATPLRNDRIYFRPGFL